MSFAFRFVPPFCTRSLTILSHPFFHISVIPWWIVPQRGGCGKLAMANCLSSILRASLYKAVGWRSLASYVGRENILRMCMILASGNSGVNTLYDSLVQWWLWGVWIWVGHFRVFESRLSNPENLFNDLGLFPFLVWHLVSRKACLLPKPLFWNCQPPFDTEKQAIQS